MIQPTLPEFIFSRGKDLTQPARTAKIEAGVLCQWPNLAGRDGCGIDDGVRGCLDRQLMVEDVGRIAEIEVSVVGEIDDGRRIGLGDDINPQAMSSVRW